MTPHPPQDTGARCHAGSDGECNWDECPQNREGEPMRSGRSCPLADWSDEEVGYPTGRITKFGAAGSPDRTASRDTPNPTEEQTSEAERYLNGDADTRRLLYAKALLERDRLRTALRMVKGEAGRGRGYAARQCLHIAEAALDG